MLDKEIILVGYSGHGFVVADIAFNLKFNLKYYSEKNELELNPFNIEYIGFEGDEDFKGWKDNYSYILGIGSNHLRQRIANLIYTNNGNILNVIHNTASLSNKINIGKGVFISRNATVNTLVTIKDFCILNTGCIIEHECVIEEAAHIGPGAVLAGNVNIGERTFVGANSVIKQGVNIGKDVIIGAGSVVLKNIPNGKKIVGNPSREI